MDDFYIKEFKKEAQELLLMQKKSGDLKWKYTS
jgi:hypothetical protein